MGMFRLILKQMRQRALGTWLTLLSVLLGVALAIAILLLRDAGAALFGQTEYGYDVIVGVGEGSATQLVMNTVYHIDKSPGNIPYWVYEQLISPAPKSSSSEFNFHKDVKLAVPIAVGDVYKGRPIIGTLPKMFLTLEPLKEQVQNLFNQINGGSPLNADQYAALISAAQQLKLQVIQTDQQLPLVEPFSADAPPPKWLYGNPIVLDCDVVISELSQAAAALKSNKPAEAETHRKNAGKPLPAIRQSVETASGPLEYRPDKTFELDRGRVFHPWKFEAVIGNEVAQKTGLDLGGQFQATHGSAPPGQAPETHAEKWRVVGVLKPTHTAADRCLYIPLISFYSIAEHESALKSHSKARNGQAVQTEQGEKPQYAVVYGDQLLPDLPHTQDFIRLDLPPDDWELSAILIKSRGGILGQELIYFIANGGIPGVQAVNPAQIMRDFFETFLQSSADVLLLISLLVSVVAGVGILVSIYNSVAARTREIAILRALGATRGRILTLICAEACLIGLIGGLIGMLVGHALGGGASAYLNRRVGQGFDWIGVRWDEWVYLAIVLAIALLAGLVPALKAYRTPVATNLVAA